MSYQRTMNSFDSALDGDDIMYDIRQKADGTWDLKYKAAWAFTVPSVDSETGFCIVDLPEMPARINTDGSNTAPIIDGYTLVVTLAEVTISATNFYCNYRRGFLVFNAAATTFALTVDSYFIGSKFSAKDLNDIWTLLSDVALESGNDTNTFSVDDPISDEHAVNKIYAETNFANINGAIDQDFTALTIQDSGGDQVVGSRQGSITPVSGTAGAAYTATEQVIINDLVTTVNDLINKLSSATGHGLIT